MPHSSDLQLVSYQVRMHPHSLEKWKVSWAWIGKKGGHATLATTSALLVPGEIHKRWCLGQPSLNRYSLCYLHCRWSHSQYMKSLDHQTIVTIRDHDSVDISCWTDLTSGSHIPTRLADCHGRIFVEDRKPFAIVSEADQCLGAAFRSRWNQGLNQSPTASQVVQQPYHDGCNYNRCTNNVFIGWTQGMTRCNKNRLMLDHTRRYNTMVGIAVGIARYDWVQATQKINKSLLISYQRLNMNNRKQPVLAIAFVWYMTDKEKWYNC